MLPQNANQDPLAVQRRPMDAEDIIDILRRHCGWILGPLLACLVIGVVTAFVWPNTYVSTAVIRVTPPQVPERFVPTNVNADVSQRINAIYQSITSRPTLTNIINLYQLYPRDRKNLPMEDVIEQMRKDVRVAPVQLMQKSSRNEPAQAYAISFAYENRLVAQKIVTELVGRFIDENIRARANQSSITTDFLRDQWEQRRRDLDEINDKVTKFRMSNQGRLPEERMSLYSAMNQMESRIGNINAQISRINQDKMMLESRLNVLKDNLREVQASGASTQAQVAKNERLAAMVREIANSELRLEAMLESYKEGHPDVRRMRSTIDVLKRRRDAIVKEEAAKAPEQTAEQKPHPAATREIRGIESEIASITTMIEARNMDLENQNQALLAADRNLRNAQARVEELPPALGEYEALVREKGLAQLRYQEMNIKMAQSQSATELENRKQGETLELLDPANLPINPTKPKRPMIVGGAAGLGLALGLVLAGAREMKDTTLKNLKDVRSYTQLMVLGSVPLLENDLVVRRRRRLAWLAWSTACLASIAIMAGSVLFYYSNKT